MKFWFSFIVFICMNCFISFATGYWWIGMLLSILYAFLNAQKFSRDAVLIPFLTIFATWLMLSLYIDIQNQSILSKKIAILFHVAQPWIIMVISAVIGGISGMLGGIIGWNLKQIKSKD